MYLSLSILGILNHSIDVLGVLLLSCSKLNHPSVDSLEGHWCNLLGSLSRVYPSIFDPIADSLGSLSSGFGLYSTDKPIIYPMTSSSLASGISSLRSTGGMNNESGSGASGDDGRGGSGGDGSGNLGNGDDGSAGAAKHRARRFSAVGGDNEMSGDGGGVGKARSLSTSSLYGNSTGVLGRIDILAVVRCAGGDGGVGAGSSALSTSVPAEGTGFVLYRLCLFLLTKKSPKTTQKCSAAPTHLSAA
ncbi:hypothetical protein Tco_0300465 [Tanacetum coccineum]